MELSGSKAIVTGGVSGFGRVIVDQLVGRQAQVGILDIDADAMGRLEAEPSLSGRRCDVSQPGEVDEMVESLCQEMDGLDILVNNAGVLYSAPLVGVAARGLVTHGVDDWQRMIETNLSSTFYVTRAAVVQMVKRRSKGVIVNVSSVSAAGNAGQSAYSAAKAGVNALTVTWAKELGPWGIRCVAVAPGYCDTPSTQRAMPATALEQVKMEMPLRELGDPREVASAVLFVIENDFCNGKVLQVDGGLRV